MRPPRPGLRILVAAVVLAAALGIGIARTRRGLPSGDPNEIGGGVLAAIEARRWDAAESGIRRLERFEGTSNLIRLLRGQVDAARGRYDEAVASVAPIPDEDRYAAIARLNQGEWERRRHHLRAAEAALLRCLKLDPRRRMARLELIYLYGVQLRGEELRDQFAILQEQGPLTSEDLCHWCRSWTAVEKPEETRSLLEPAVAADPGDRRSRLVLAEAVRLLGHLDESAGLLQSLSPTDPDARAGRARLALDRGDRDGAVALLEAGPRRHLGLALLRGRLALLRRDPEGARDAFAIAHSIAPDDRDAAFGLGHALQLLRRNADAAPLLARARLLDALSGLVQHASTPDARPERELLLRLGRTCEALGRIPEARGWFLLLTSRDPLDREAQSALFRLRNRDRRPSSAPTPTPRATSGGTSPLRRRM